MPQFGTHIDEDLQLLDIKIKQLKNEYEQYFLGTRPRAPGMLRSEVQKMVTIYANTPIQNTGYRFKFNNLRARFFAFRRHWDETCRKIEEGTHERQLFRAKLGGGAPTKRPRRKGARLHEASDPSLYETYVAAREACGQGVAGLSREKLDNMLQQQVGRVRDKLGCANVGFKVVVEQGKAKLKAVPK